MIKMSMRYRSFLILLFLWANISKTVKRTLRVCSLLIAGIVLFFCYFYISVTLVSVEDKKWQMNAFVSKTSSPPVSPTVFAQCF